MEGDGSFYLWVKREPLQGRTTSPILFLDLSIQ
jgi:hypothetical protein